MLQRLYARTIDIASGPNALAALLIVSFVESSVFPIPPDILLIPLAAFDSAGYRIGYGGGYYDRTLALYRGERQVTAIGIAYDEQEVPNFTPEPHDQPLDYLITPSGVRSFGI